MVDDTRERRPGAPRLATVRSGHAAYATVLGLAIPLYWLSARHPALMPVWAPWDFSPVVYLATALTGFWFCRGLARTPRAARPARWRTVAFGTGVIVTYAVLQTRFEYWSQHMFFLNRIQHVTMHHLGPMLIALGGAGPTLRRGMPGRFLPVLDSRVVAAILRVTQEPLAAATLFVGLFWFWLIPEMHFRAMIDPRLYALMNWSMVVDGLLFWCLVLDPRPSPPARASHGARMALALGVMFPQIVLGALITFAGFDLYPYYDLCGRLLPGISAVDDQQIGGLVIWIPPAMMSIIAMLLVLNALRLHDAAKESEDARSLRARR